MKATATAVEASTAKAATAVEASAANAAATAERVPVAVAEIAC